MISLYIEPNKIEEFALFDEEMPHWNKIIKSGIEININISQDDLDERLIDDFDPISIAYSSSATMQLPKAKEVFIQEIKKDLDKTIENPRAIYVLDIKEETAEKKQKKLGMAIYATSKVPDTVFSKSYFREVSKNEIIQDGWEKIIEFEKPLSNSLVIADNYYFSNETGNLNRGLTNLIPFLAAYLPLELEIEYQITIVAQNIRENRHKPNDWWIKEYGKLVTAVNLLRNYTINIELVLAKSEIHKRRILSNYTISKADKGFDLFYSNQLEKIKEENDFEYLEIFSNLDNTGTKHYESVNNIMSQLVKHCSQISTYVSVKNNQLDRSLFGCNPDKTIKNRLLN
ncbi:hypothetical protein GCM10023311_13240 [Flaviramulus aquimarinus]|uniref:Uncharacterized protein n=1 Tax=Flaviramulus aquimarinus TaxID=1170456 RepID=A0ABP9F172_9FLAO